MLAPWVAMRVSDLLLARIGTAVAQGLDGTEQVRQALLGEMTPSQVERAEKLRETIGKNTLRADFRECPLLAVSSR